MEWDRVGVGPGQSLAAVKVLWPKGGDKLRSCAYQGGKLLSAINVCVCREHRESGLAGLSIAG